MARTLNVPMPANMPEDLVARLRLAVNTLNRTHATYVNNGAATPVMQARSNMGAVVDRFYGWIDAHDTALDPEWLEADKVTQTATENGVVLSLHLTREITQSQLDQGFVNIPA